MLALVQRTADAGVEAELRVIEHVAEELSPSPSKRTVAVSPSTQNPHQSGVRFSILRMRFVNSEQAADRPVARGPLEGENLRGGAARRRPPRPGV